MNKKVIALCILLTSSWYINLYACTLYGCIGTHVKGKGILIAKNRDMPDRQPWAIKLVTPTDGKYKFLGMCADVKDDRSIRGGVNEKGLAMFDADASANLHELFKMDTNQTLYKILSNCTTIDEVLQSAKKYFFGTGFFILSDHREIAYIEIVGDNNYKIKRIKQGDLYHTNHYLEPAFLSFNQKKVEGSKTRYDRIQNLINSKDTLTLDDFITFCKDKNAGPNYSINRDGDSTHQVRTLGTMCVYVPFDKTQNPEVYMRIRNKGEHEFKESKIILNKQFWNSQFIIQ